IITMCSAFSSYILTNGFVVFLLILFYVLLLTCKMLTTIEDYLHYLPDKQSPLLNPYSRGGLRVYYVSVTD
ncbi:hypothetical protein, partial [Prevotella aurantiaca]